MTTTPTPERRPDDAPDAPRWEVPILIRCTDTWTAYATVAAPTAEAAVQRIKDDPDLIHGTLELVKEVDSEGQEFAGIRADVDVRRADEQPHGK